MYLEKTVGFNLATKALKEHPRCRAPSQTSILSTRVTKEGRSKSAKESAHISTAQRSQPILGLDQKIIKISTAQSYMTDTLHRRGPSSASGRGPQSAGPLISTARGARQAALARATHNVQRHDNNGAVPFSAASGHSSAAAVPLPQRGVPLPRHPYALTTSGAAIRYASANNNRPNNNNNNDGHPTANITFRVPTCGLAAHEHALSHKMLRWALEAGADLLPPTAALARRSAVLERPTAAGQATALAEASERAAETFKRMYVSHLCVRCDEGEGGGGGGGRRKKGRSLSRNADEDDGSEQMPRFILSAGGRGTAQSSYFSSSFSSSLLHSYNAFQRRRFADAAARAALRAGDALWADRMRREYAAEAAGSTAAATEEGDQKEEEQRPLRPMDMSVSDIDPQDVLKALADDEEGGEGERGSDEENEGSARGYRQQQQQMTLRQQRELLRASELALLKISRAVEQGPGYVLPLHSHGRSSSGAHAKRSSSACGPSASSARKPPFHTRASALRSAAAAAAFNVSGGWGSSRGGGSGYPYPVPSHNDPAAAAALIASSSSSSSSSSAALSSFAALDGTYQMPSRGSLAAARSEAVRFAKASRLVAQLRQLDGSGKNSKLPSHHHHNTCRGEEGGEEGCGEEEESNGNGDDDGDDEELDDGGAAEGDNDHPLLDVSFCPRTGTLSVKARLSEAQLLTVRATIVAPKANPFATEGAAEEEKEPAVSSSPFLFQSEFVAIAPDVWLGARGPWRGRVLHVARKVITDGPSRKNGGACSALLPPPYLPALAQVLDACGGSAPTPYGPHSTATSPAPSAIDSIVVGPWVFVRREARPGGRPTDPYQCVGCGNTRLGHNIAYAAPDAPSGLRRGRYYCPYCRRATNHINVSLATDPSAATRTQQWDGGAKLARPSCLM